VHLLYRALGVDDGDPRVTRFLGARAGDRTSVVAGAGDPDGDGVPDVLVGAPFADRPEAPDAGVVHLIRGASLIP
jgi:hypothetical protein